MKNNFILILFFLYFFINKKSSAQVDLLSLLDSLKTEHTNEKVYATFKTTKVINAQSIELAKKKTMDFRITHRFGNAGTGSNGGGHTLYGIDNSEDIRISFDFGVTDKLMVGIGRSKRSENIDALLKYRFLEQTTDNKIPLSMALYGAAAFTPQDKLLLYSGTVNFEDKLVHRFSYVTQLILARKFNSRFSMEILPTFTHRNYIKALVNSFNRAPDENNLMSVGFAGRIKLTKRFAILADYFYTISEYRIDNPITKYYFPLALGIEIETGGHVFHLDFTNSSGIIENDFIPNTTDSWLRGGFKFGFNISRVFDLYKPPVKN